MLCDAFEAVMGAVCMDARDDPKPVAKILCRLIGDIEPNPEQRILKDNPKDTLQEWVQKYRGSTLQYETVDRTGPDHEKVFTVNVTINEECVGTGVAHSKKQAEQQAARCALEKLTLQEELTGTNSANSPTRVVAVSPEELMGATRAQHSPKQILGNFDE